MAIINKKYLSTPLTLPIIVATLLISTSACSNQSAVNTNEDLAEYKEAKTSDANSSMSADKPDFTTKAIAKFDEPWAMTVLPKVDNAPQRILVTQKTGELFIVDTAKGNKTKIEGVPKVAYGGQGGLGDVIIAPDFVTSNNIYLSYVEAGKGADSNKFGAKVIKATLSGLETTVPSLQAITPIWEQSPKVKGQGHYSHRLLFSPDGQYLFISSGERQEKTPAQDMKVNLGKIIRLNPDGSAPTDNPFSDTGNDIAKQFWTVGHRNVLGMAFDDNGRLWAHEMGPRGGDEFNLIEKGNNYGWPIVSNGRNYSGIDIPDHNTRPEFEAPKITWTPVISPSSMSIYTAGNHNDFPSWQGNALISGLSSKALIIVSFDKDNRAAEHDRYDMGERIRSVLAVDGQVWVLEDGNDGRLLRLMPK
ncbi:MULTISPECIES: PQQ-dependent sugar dehydrogenase [unclassified Psychrobacter]|uniref:PQQ-dependent sugar dehydrogenase n=1 Tax=unclassified Psychrobacter TaxID=196806 RepID=UPI0025B36E62|nr:MULTISPECIES: PQQ-dependent sugar dehydrogenase [unclassified Psychrobacter]MDN3452885.1 PQQ-dependent sugar dehydrogenase [Psychrobacter sp. APC 3350]MDN3502093.1 PQQ-dependent sugar dehydrogenase [Psychrobacter sp. 5A.1]